MSRLTRSVLALLAAAAFAAGVAAPVDAAPGGRQGSAGSGQDYDAQADHKPTGTGSGRKIG